MRSMPPGAAADGAFPLPLGANSAGVGRETEGAQVARCTEGQWTFHKRRACAPLLLG